VAEIFNITEGNVSISVAKGDGPSNIISINARKRENFT